MALVASAFEVIPPLTGTEGSGFAWTIYTGDLASHLPDDEGSQAMIEYSEVRRENIDVCCSLCAEYRPRPSYMTS